MTIGFDDLPQVLPVFPLPCVLLLPRGQLPLNIFEPRYVAMIDAALKADRMIGIIQPRMEGGEIGALYDIGCAGRITEFSETDDGRYLINLTGVCRFHVAEELEKQDGFRRVRPDWTPFRNDFQPAGCLGLDRAALKTMLQDYFRQHELSCDWDAIDGAPDEKLITCLSMICPFDASEKQALMETVCCRERAKKFMTMLKMAIHEPHKNCGGHH